jgi:hypothetical protein
MEHQVPPPQHPVALALNQATHNSPLLDREVLVETTDGRTIRGRSAIWGWDPDSLLLPQQGEADIRVPFAQVRTVLQKGLRPGRVGVLVVGLLVAGAYLGKRLLLGANDLELREAMFLGALAAAFVSPVVIWLLQDVPWLTRYRVLYPEG